jgi:hypothetical protein
MKAVFCLVAFLQLSCYYQRMVNADPCIEQTLAITADNKLVLYIDGDQVTDLQHANAFNHADFVPLSASTRVIAVNAQSNGKHGGILASSITFVTDASWKCTNQFYDGWQTTDFNDSGWAACDEVAAHGVKPPQQVDGIEPAALWIWLGPQSSGNEVFARKRLDCDGPTPTPAAPTPTQAPPDPVPQSCRGASGETGQSCITSCGDRVNGDYQSCKGCQVYAACHNGILHDNRPCASGRYWDDVVKRCEEKSATCQECK